MIWTQSKCAECDQTMYFREGRKPTKYCATCFRACAICGQHVPKGHRVMLRDAVGYDYSVYMCAHHTDENDLIEFGRTQIAWNKDNCTHRTDEDILLEMYERDKKRGL